MAERLEAIKDKVQSYGGDFLYVGVPGQSSVFMDQYPIYLDNKKDYFLENEREFFRLLKEKNVDYINMNDFFKEKNPEDYYYKTDHHFNFLGSIESCQSILNAFNMKTNIKEDLDIIEIETPMSGSRNRQVYYLYPSTERLSYGVFKEEVPYEKYVNGNRDDKLYYFTEEAPTYNIYMNGDQGEILIKTNRTEKESLLIVGDSFTNTMEPILYYYFDTTYILDFRHYKEMDLSEYIEIHKPDRVIYVRDDLNYGNLEGNGQIK